MKSFDKSYNFLQKTDIFWQKLRIFEKTNNFWAKN